MTSTTQLAPFKGQRDSVWENILEFADNSAASVVCKVFNQCQKAVINRLWGGFNLNQLPIINYWINKTTIFGDRPRVAVERPMITGKALTQFHRLLTAGVQTSEPLYRPIHPLSFISLEKERNDRDLMKCFPRLEKQLSKFKHLLPDDLLSEQLENPDQIRTWIKRAVDALKSNFPNGAALFAFDFSELGIAAIPKELAAFKPFTPTITRPDGAIGIIANLKS